MKTLHFLGGYLVISLGLFSASADEKINMQIAKSVLVLCLIMTPMSCKPMAQKPPESIPKTTEAPPPPTPATLPSPVIQLPKPVVIKPGQTFSGIPEDSRVQEIAGWLSPNPQGLGKPITDRTAWAGFPNPKAVLKLAEHELTEPIPELTDDLFLIYSRKGTRIEYEIPYQHRTKRLADFAVAECIENKGRFLPAIEAELTAILGERTWALPAHDTQLKAFNGKQILDLGVTMRSWNLATVDYLLGAKLRPETREKIRTEVNRRVLQPYKAQILDKTSGTAGWIGSLNNWNAVCHAGVIGSALALLPEARDRAWFLASMEIYIRNYLASFTADGYCSEGIGYWNYGFGHYALMAQAVGEATQWRLNLYAPEIVRNVLDYPRRLEMLPGIYPAFADNVPSVKPSPWIPQVVGAKISGGFPPVKPVIVSGVSAHPLAALLYETMTVAFAEPSATTAATASHAIMPLRDNFPDAGVVVLRPSDAVSGKGLAIAIKAGQNSGGHGHNDVGSYVVALNTKTPLLDPGMELYTSRTFGPHRYDSKVLNSYGHSVPVVAGKLQDTGAEARGTITAIQTSDAEDSYDIDFARAYIKSVPSLKKLTRHLRYIRLPQPAIEISDEVEFDSPQSFGDALITFGKCQTLSADTLVIYDGAEALQVKINTDSHAFTLNNEVLEENLPSGQKARRVGLSLNEPATHSRIAYRIEATNPPVVGNPVIDKAAAEAHGPGWNQMLTVEAEQFSGESGGKVEKVSKQGASGGMAIRMWNNDGHELTWKFQAPQDGTYGILLRYCNGGTGDALRALNVDGSPVDGIEGGFAFPPTGGWSADQDDWKEVWLAQSGRVYVVNLKAGEHAVSLKNVEGGAVTLDWIALVPLTK